MKKEEIQIGKRVKGYYYGLFFPEAVIVNIRPTRVNGSSDLINVEIPLKKQYVFFEDEILFSNTINGLWEID